MRLVSRLSIAAFACAVTTSATAETRIGPLVDRAVGYLKSSRDADGAFSPHMGPAITGLVATGLLRHGRSINDPMVADAVAYVVRFAKPDGGIYADDSMYRNYETCIAVQCLREAANAPGATKDYASELAAAEAFIKGLQWDEAEGHDTSSVSYGGAGYGRHKRPDLSNTSYLIDALHSLGSGADDPAMQRALAFVSRTQNLETEHNTTEFAAKVNDGGFYYTPAAGGSSQAGETANGGLRSYASMTYAGLKSLIYAGVAPGDPRVKAASEWVSKHYSLAENPGMGKQGLYYYYHTFAKALDALGGETLVDADGVEHDWRAELIDTLAAAQQPTGAWVNDNDRWMEADPNLVTAFALLALSHCD